MRRKAIAHRLFEFLARLTLLGLTLPLSARENLLQEAKAEPMDAILMLGDHAYNWAMGDERRVRRHDIAGIWVAFFSS